MIIGITGTKYSGKDTLANIIKIRNPQYNILHFADYLKLLSHKIFQIPIDYFHVPKLKEVQINPIDMDQYLPLIRYYTGLKINPHNKIATTTRKLIQYFGTEYVRSVNNLFWINHVKNKILKDNNKNYIIPDVRFNNESDMIYQLNGYIIKIKRLNSMQVKIDNHSSENINTLPFNMILNVPNNNYILQHTVAKLIQYNLLELFLQL